MKKRRDCPNTTANTLLFRLILIPMKQPSVIHTFYRGIVTIAVLLTVSSFLQCSEDKEPDFQKPAAHTLLVYIAGDNNLADIANRNIRSMQQGLLDSGDNLNLLIFKDNGSKIEKPALFQLRSNKHQGIDTLYIAQYDYSIDATSPEVMRAVLDDAFSLYHTPLNGIVLWSHAMSWIPSPTFRPASAVTAPAVTSLGVSGPQAAPAYFGQDRNNYMELWELRSVLEEIPALDYILMDACHFASAETAYELKDVARYLLAAPTEIMGNGFPYRKVVPILARMKKSEIESALVETAQAFAEEYSDNGTISLIDMAGIENLADRYAFFRHRHADILTDMATSPTTWHSKLQRYGRRRTGALYYFYDFEDAIRQIADQAEGNDADNDVTAILDALNYIIRYTYHSEDFSDGRENLHIDRSCGMTVSLPELFQLSENSLSLASAYPLTRWGARMQAELGITDK